MTANEFQARHKRVFVALAAYGWVQSNRSGRCRSKHVDRVDWDYVLQSWFSPVGLRIGLRIVPNHPRPFWFNGQIPSRTYSSESSVLAALAKIHAGQMP